MNEAKTALRKARAARVAEFMFRQRLERIEWEENFLKPYLEDLALQLNAGEMPVIELLEEHAH